MKKSTLKKHKKNKHKSCVNGNIESNRAQNNKRLGDCAKDKVLRGSGIMISGISHFQTIIDLGISKHCKKKQNQPRLTVLHIT